MTTPTTRPETHADAAAVGALVTAAFLTAEHGSGTEAAIVAALRTAGALTVSLVAEDSAGTLLGHVAFSPVTIAGRDSGWHGLGPVAVAPDRQRAGIGGLLVRAGLDRLKALGGQGCVVLGDPAYYGRFGFRADPRLTYGGAPPVYFQALAFGGDLPLGEVAYHPAFGAG